MPGSCRRSSTPELRAGDLLVVNEHVWHEAPPGTTSEDRCGIFHKYCAANAPPAAGYYPYDRAALEALSDAGKRLLPVCFDKPIATTRLLIESPSGAESRFLVRRAANTGAWELPGGAGWEEQELVGWDIGARIGSLQALVNSQLGLDVPWMSYIEDLEQEDGACRVYGYSDEEREPGGTGQRQQRLVHAQRAAPHPGRRATRSAGPSTLGCARTWSAARARRAIRAGINMSSAVTP